MAKCKCGGRARIVSNGVKNLRQSSNPRCIDVCANPIYESPSTLSIMTPLIYDEIGINLCTTFDLGEDISEEYPAAVTASARVLDITYDDGDVVVEAISGRPNCYDVTLSNLTVQFAVNLYDANCRLVTTLFPTAVYLPSCEKYDTYDEDTNPTSVEFEIFAPYGIGYNKTCGTFTPVVNYIGFLTTNSYVRQGLNLYSMAKVIDFEIDDDSVTVGLTLVLQSLYHAGYNVASEGKINTPKGSIITPDNTSCMNFVAGDLLNLAIKPLELGPPNCEEQYKHECCEQDCGDGATDDTTVLPGIGDE